MAGMLPAASTTTDPRANPEAATGFYEFSLRALFRLLCDGACILSGDRSDE